MKQRGIIFLLLLTILGNMTVCAMSVDEHYADALDDVQSYHLIFTDLEVAAWAKPAIGSLTAQGIISGIDRTHFEPMRSISRKEFVKLLVGVSGMTDMQAKCRFSDVPEGDWSYPYVASAVQCGIIREDAAVFDGDIPITRAEIADMCANALEALGYTVAIKEKTTFADEEAVPDAAYYLRQIGIVHGDDANRFRPNDACTRAETAQMLHQLLEYIRKTLDEQTKG